MELEPISDEAAAVWVRAMAALIDASLPVKIKPTSSGRELIFELEVDSAPEALLEMGRRMNSLVEDRRSHARGDSRGQGRDADPRARESNRPHHEHRPHHERDDRGRR
ncbi:MAG: hypothetical protein GXP55_19135 [Deltaproteobacteria bacterium]|nr:hypothetical protein [Deltaproteobacteria bacterium]